MNQNKNVDLNDIILGILYTVLFVGSILVLRLAFGIDIDKLTPSENQIVEAVIMGGLVFTIGSLYLKFIYHWLDKWIKFSGDRSLEKKTVHDIPVNTNSTGFKYSFHTAENQNTSRMIEDKGMYEEFEETVWFTNMEQKRKVYRWKLNKMKKKLVKKVRSNDPVSIKKAEEIKSYIVKCNEMNNAIRLWSKKATEKLNDELYDYIGVEVDEIQADEVIHTDIRNPIGFFEKLKHNPILLWLDKNFFPLLFPVLMIVLTVYYNVIWKDQWSVYEQNAFNLLMSMFLYMLPLRMYQFFSKYFPRQELKPVLTSAAVFQKFRNRYFEESQEFKKILDSERLAFEARLKSLLEDEDDNEDKGN